MRKSGATREVTWPLIRKAAIDLLYTHGFNVMNLRQLSGAAGLQAGSLYNYFNSGVFGGIGLAREGETLGGIYRELKALRKKDA